MFGWILIPTGGSYWFSMSIDKTANQVASKQTLVLQISLFACVIGCISHRRDTLSKLCLFSFPPFFLKKKKGERKKKGFQFVLNGCHEKKQKSRQTQAQSLFSGRKIAFSSESLLRANEFKPHRIFFLFRCRIFWIFVKEKTKKKTIWITLAQDVVVGVCAFFWHIISQHQMLDWIIRGCKKKKIVQAVFFFFCKSSGDEDSYLVDPASSHMLVSKIKPCMSEYKQLYTVKLRMAH